MVEAEGTDPPDERARVALAALRGQRPGVPAGADPALDELFRPGPAGWLAARHADMVRRWPSLADRPAVALGSLAVVAALVLGTAAWWLAGPAGGSSGPPPTLAFTSTTMVQEGAEGAPSTTTPSALVVHAAGAVHEPGVHRVPAGARVADVLGAAGGSTPDADLDRLNLAAPVADGARLYVPRVGEDRPPTVIGPVSGDPGDAGVGDGEGAAAGIDVNRATATELEALPGVGPTTAEAIVAHREANGPFRRIDDLLEVRGIGPSKLEGMRDQVVLG